MSTLFWLIVGFLIGLFLPSPIDQKIKSWILSLWNKIKPQKKEE